MIYTKKIKAFLMVIFFLFSPFVVANGVKFVNKKHIAKEIPIIRQMIHDHYVVKYGLLAASIGCGALDLIQLYRQFRSSPRMVVPERVAEQGERPPEPGFFESIGNGLCNVGRSMISPRAWGNGALAVGKAVAQTGSYLLMHVAIAEAMKKFNHDDTLTWFFDQKTSFVSLRAALLDYAAVIESGTSTPEKYAYNKALLIEAAQQWVIEIEKIVAYVLYKGKKEAHCHAASLITSKYVINKTNTFVTVFNQKIAAGDGEAGSTGYTVLVETFCRELIDDLNSFARFDKEDDVNRVHKVLKEVNNAVKMVKRSGI